ncbi:MAG: hypothetical protein V8T87_01845 [Victivallales bacterium]
MNSDTALPLRVRSALRWISVLRGIGRKERILELLDSKPEIDRIIGVCCETSSGMVNDIAMLNRICEARGIWFALDAVSALGVESGFCSCPALAMATGSSGKALAGVPGIAILLLNPRFPRSVSEVQPKILQLPPVKCRGWYTIP